jgi:hypothetical protein
VEHWNKLLEHSSVVVNINVKHHLQPLIWLFFKLSGAHVASVHNEKSDVDIRNFLFDSLEIVHIRVVEIGLNNSSFNSRINLLDFFLNMLEL